MNTKTEKGGTKMTEQEKQAAMREAFVGSGENGEIWLMDVYEHFGYVEENGMMRYEDDGFPSGQYTTHFDDGPDTLKRMLSIIDYLRTDRKIRIVIDCDPEFPVSMMRYWGTHNSKMQYCGPNNPDPEEDPDIANAEQEKR